MESPQDLLPTQQPDQEQEAPAEEEVLPTKSVKNFWERLDEVFVQNTELRERMEELVGQFPESQQANGPFKSFIFQPERLSLSSNDDIQQNRNAIYNIKKNEGHLVAETFSNFRIRLRRPLRNVKSIQLLSGVIPNAIQNIPDTQCIFFYYRLRTIASANLGIWTPLTTYNPGDIITYLGNTYVLNTTDIANLATPPPANSSYQIITLPADTTRPNYYDLNSQKIEMIQLLPTFSLPPEDTGQYLLYNRTFQDYDDLVASLNAAANSFLTASIPGDITFTYNAQLNKIQFQGAEVNAVEPANYFYLPCGYEDPNLPLAITNPSLLSLLEYTSQDIFLQGYTLNLRLGYTWNGIFPNPFLTPNIYTDSAALVQLLYFYLRKKDPGLPPLPIQWNQNLLTANSYGDLVNTSCVRIYADFALASTQDSLGSSAPANTPVSDGLLSIVPVNASNLGVAFYQNNFNNPLTKIPENIAEIGITMLNDQGQPYYLPNSAVVLLELAVEYK